MPLDGPGLNALLDRLPRLWFDVGPRRVPAFRSLGIIGFHAAVVIAVATALRTGVSLVSALGLSAVAGLSFFGWGLLRRAVTGRESLVLIEYVWVAYGAVAGFAWAAGLDAAPLLDVYSVAVATFLAFGRFGCTTAGCCHGHPASVGLRYGAEHALPERLVGRRLFPVQLVEALALLAISSVGFVVAPIAAGTATVWFLAAYAAVRFGCERLRGDRRPVVLGLPVAQTMCAVQATAAIAASEAWLVPGAPGRATAVGTGVLAATTAAGVALAASRRRNPLVAPDHLDEVWQIVTSSPPPDPVAVATSQGMLVAASSEPQGWHVSMSHTDQDTAAVALALGGTATTTLRGVTHTLLPRCSPLESPRAVDASAPTDATRWSASTTTMPASRDYFAVAGDPGATSTAAMVQEPPIDSAMAAVTARSWSLDDG